MPLKVEDSYRDHRDRDVKVSNIIYEAVTERLQVHFNAHFQLIGQPLKRYFSCICGYKFQKTGKYY